MCIRDRIKEAEPQLTLRFYEGMDSRLMEKALETIGEGRTYPMLYNDDVNIPAVSNAFRISTEEAEDYVPFGCGEYVINHKSFGSPNGVINLLKVLEITLHNGMDGMTGKEAGIRTGYFSEFKSFDELWEAYTKQVQYFIEDVYKRQFHRCVQCLLKIKFFFRGRFLEAENVCAGICGRAALGKKDIGIRIVLGHSGFYGNTVLLIPKEGPGAVQQLIVRKRSDEGNGFFPFFQGKEAVFIF